MARSADRAGTIARTALRAKAPKRSHCAGPRILWTTSRNTKQAAKRVRAQAAAGEQTIVDSRNQEEDMLALCAATNRGQSADAAQRGRMASLISSMESDFKAAGNVDGLLSGTWLLVYSSEVLLIETTHTASWIMRLFTSRNHLHASRGTFHCFSLGSNRFKPMFLVVAESDTLFSVLLGLQGSL